MLGDSGANAIGAMLGVAAASLPRRSRVLVLGGVAALTAVSEKVSFTSVIARTPALNWLDMLGRRPARSAAAPTAPADTPAGPDARLDSAIMLDSETRAASAPAETSRPQ